MNLSAPRRFALLAVATALATSLPSIDRLWPCPSSHHPAWFAHGVLGPVVALLVTTAFLAPGFAFARIFGIRGTPARRLVGAGLCAALWAIVGGIASGLWLTDFEATTRAAFETAFVLLPVLAAWGRSFRDAPDPVHLGESLPYFLPAALLPAIWGPALWSREFTSDGLESYVLGRALDLDPFPTFLTQSGGAGLGSGGYLSAYLVHALFPFLADLEAVPRFLAVVASPVLTAAVVDAAEVAEVRPRPIDCAAATTLGIGVLGTHATFDPHLVDPASPAAWDVPAGALLVALAARLRTGSFALVALLAGLATLARPSAPLVAVAVGASLFLMRGVERRAILARVLVAIATAVAVTLVVERVLLPHFRPGSEGFLESGGLLRRLRAVTWSGQDRWWWVLAASGGALLPALVAALRPARPLARTFAVAGLSIGLFFTLTRGFAPHHVMPAVGLLWVAAAIQGSESRVARGLSLAGLALAAFAARPTMIDGPSPARDLGAHVAVDPAFAPPSAMPASLRRPFPQREGFCAFRAGRGTLLAARPLSVWRASGDALAPLVRLPFEDPTNDPQHEGTVGLMPIVAAAYAHLGTADGTCIAVDASGRLVPHPEQKAWTRAPKAGTPVAPRLRIPRHALFPTGEPRVGIDCDLDFGIWKRRILGS